MTTAFVTCPTITLFEPLIDFFGTPINKNVEFKLEDVFKVAGHACPTVLGAYLMTYYSLKALYGENLPVRGEIEISFQTSEDNSTTGVVGSVMGMITGAAGIGGFKGLAGNFSRNKKLVYQTAQDHKIIFKRLDNGYSLAVDYSPAEIEFSKDISTLLDLCIKNEATVNQKAEMNFLWNERLQNIIDASLIHDRIVKIKKLNY